MLLLCKVNDDDEVGIPFLYLRVTFHMTCVCDVDIYNLLDRASYSKWGAFTEQTMKEKMKIKSNSDTLFVSWCVHVHIRTYSKLNINTSISFLLLLKMLLPLCVSASLTSLPFATHISMQSSCLKEAKPVKIKIVVLKVFVTTSMIVTIERKPRTIESSFVTEN